MSSLFGRLKSSNAPGDAPAKKGEPQVAPSPLELLLADAGPLRNDGSDKFFGMHNPSNTCYCNSVLQCLYFSENFREQVINFPKPKPRATNARMSMYGSTPQIPPTPSATQPTKSQSDGFFGFKKANTGPTSPTTPGVTAPPENKDTFDTMKKAAFASGPHIKMEEGNFETYEMPESLFTGLKDIFESIIVHQSRWGIVTPAKFLEVLKRNYELFRSPMHQDAHEFLNLLLNEVVEQVESHTKNKNGSTKPLINLPISKAITDSTTSTNSSSWVHELFEGTLTSETRCLTCENVSQRDEVFLDLSVDLEEHSSVTSCLRKFSAEEMLCERNKFHCDQCSGLQEAEKRMKIKRLPRILALHLKRFKYNEEAGRLHKLFHRVVYPFHLRLFNTTDDAEDPDRLYELYAVIVHLGSTPFHGHYVSIIKTKDKGWLLFDDELVLPVDKNYVRNFFGGDPRNPACAYVLFYQETTVEAVEKEQEAEDPVIDPITHAVNGGGLKLDTSIPMAPSLASVDGLLTPTGEELDGSFALEHAATAPTTPPLPMTMPSAFDVPLAASYHHEPSPLSPAITNNTDERSSTSTNGRPPPPVARSASFNRFRPGSMSLRQKPKLFKFGASSDLKELPNEGESSPIVTNYNNDRPSPEPPVEKPKRFGLGRKRSSMMPPSRD